VDDEAVVRAVAVAVGVAELGALLAQHSAVGWWFEAGEVTQAMGMASPVVNDSAKHAKVAPSLLEQAASTAAAKQLELDIRGALAFGECRH
jgi:hypothetical protein